MLAQTILNSYQIVGMDYFHKLINLTIIAKNIYDVHIIATFIDAKTLSPDQL